MSSEPFPPSTDDDPGWELRYERVRRLGDTRGPEALHALLELTDDPNRSVRCAVALALANHKDEESLGALVGLLSDPEVWVRIRAAQAMMSFRGSKAPDYLAQHLETEEDEKARATYVKAIGSFGDERFVPVLLPYLQDEDARVRANTIEGLGFIGTDSVRDILRPFLDDPNARIRANAARIMSRFAADVAASRATLDAMLSSSDQYERASAVYALGELRDSAYLDHIMALLADRSFVVRRNVVDAIIKHGADAEKRLLKFLEHDDATVRATTCQILGAIGGRAALRAAVPHLDDADGEVRSRCEEAVDAIEQRIGDGGRR